MRNVSSTSPVFAQIIPVKCGSSGSCLPVTEEENSVNLEVSSGKIRIKASDEVKSFDFLTSTFGGVLPNHDVSIFLSDPVDACGPIHPISSHDEVQVQVDGASGGAKVSILTISIYLSL